MKTETTKGQYPETFTLKWWIAEARLARRHRGKRKAKKVLRHLGMGEAPPILPRTKRPRFTKGLHNWPQRVKSVSESSSFSLGMGARPPASIHSWMVTPATLPRWRQFPILRRAALKGLLGSRTKRRLVHDQDVKNFQSKVRRGLFTPGDWEKLHGYPGAPSVLFPGETSSP